MRPALAAKLSPFGTTIFTEMTRLAVQHGAINLAQGFPDFDGPEHVKEAAIAAIRAGHGQYARMTGIPALSRAIAEKYQRDYGLSFDPDREVTVTSGCTEAIFAAINGLCDPGDEVILFQPYYDSYRASVVMAGAVPKVVTLRHPDWSFSEAELQAAFSPRTRILLLNTPHNPTGKVFSRAELAVIAALCVRHDVICISDEVYEHITFDAEHVPIATLPGMGERTLTLSSLGKTWSLTGWKIGWAVGPADLSAAVRAAHQFITFATATPLQHGAVVALDTSAEWYPALRADYRRKRDKLAEALTWLGFDVSLSAGTYFLCAGIAPLGFDDDVVFCRFLIERGVAAIPPSAFYLEPGLGRGYVRFAFCKKDATLDAAIERLGRAFGGG